MSSDLTTWDVAFFPDDLWIESKLKPTRQDVIDWLTRAAISGSASLKREFHLIYHKGAGAHLDSIETLIRIGKEANSNSIVFDLLAKAEGFDEQDEFRKILGDGCHELLPRMKLEQVPEYILEHDIRLMTRLLAGQLGGERLRDLLFRKFQVGGAHRTTFLIVDIIDDAREMGIDFSPSPDVETRDISPLAKAILIVLQSCSAGVPLEVLVAALDSRETDVRDELDELQKANVVTLDEQFWTMRPLPASIMSASSGEILANTLTSVLDFVETDRGKISFSRHVRNVIDLAKKCRSRDPKLVASLFTRLDKQLKRLGNKRQVWYVASLSIKAARHAPARDRDPEMIDYEARALICGTSWAFQRLHKLESARLEAHQSLKLAKDAGLDRTLAFCLKCLGRLCRMEAEEMSLGNERNSKLAESVKLLEEAIERFGLLGQFGPTHPEVGDCYSLLGRTYLESKMMVEAQKAIRKAYRLIVDDTSKDYIDLVILHGDLAAAQGDPKSATDNYDRALAISSQLDPEISEMRARAFFKHGSMSELAGRKEDARLDYASAADIWTSLEDHESAAAANWKKLLLELSLPKEAMAILEKERAIVRVETLSTYLSSIRQTSSLATVGRRAELPKEYWIQKIKESKARLAAKLPEF